MTNRKGLIINYDYCTGCRACEMACRQNDFPIENCGIKVVQIGPVPLYKSKWLFDYIPIRTDLCHFCWERTNKGKLTLCEHHCPTQCIKPDRTIDARKCISFLTIENKEGIPRHVRGDLCTWIFGCDICQEVCPWNKKLKIMSAPSIFPEPFHGKFDLFGALSL